ncbi:MAG TPA: histone deacetylase [Firmicutes bacterium]|nr:histone deacetylase [Bacillota bacterium]
MLKAKRSVGLVFFPAFDWCITPDHPEREERLLYTRDQIMEEGLLDIEGIEEYRPTVAATKHVQRAHICVPSVASLVTESHLIAAGGAMLAADLVLEGKVERSFALLRPPGHHAMRIVHGSRGFCTVNSEAIMVEHIRHRFGPQMRIAIVDTDAHHADGTQDIFYNDPYILHISLHQDGRTLYPGSGGVFERGGPAARGQTVNIPLPPGTGDAGILYVLEELVMPILSAWQPDLVINAAGQDNHYSDPLTNMRFSAQGYARLTEMLNPDIVILEGGYSIEGALPYVNVGILLALGGLDYSQVREPDWDETKVTQSKAVTAAIRDTVAQVRVLWESRQDPGHSRAFGDGPFYHRERQIYYDTDGIFEEQQERIRLCPQCSGWRHIYSTATRQVGILRMSGRSTRIGAVVVPWLACPQCRKDAEEEYQRLMREGNLDYCYFQDSEQDRFLTNVQREF